MPKAIRIRTAFVFVLLFTANSFAANFEVTNGDSSGAGSLRQAVLDANANGNPGEVDTITFNGVTEIIQGDLDPLSATGDITITESVAITGPGQKDLTIDGQYEWINSSGVINGGFPDNPTSIILTESGNLFEVGTSGGDNSGIKVTISGMKVTRTGGLVTVREGADVEIVDVFASDNAFLLQESAPLVEVASGKLVIKDSYFSGNKWNDNIIVSGLDALITNTTFVGNPNTNSRGMFLAGTVVEIVDSQILDDGVQHHFLASDTYIANTVFKRQLVSPLALIYLEDSNLYLNNVTIYSHTTPESVPVNQPSHLWLSGSSLSMANTVIAPEVTGLGSVKPLVRLQDGSTVALNTNNHVSDGSLTGTATGEADLEGPFINPFSFKPLAGGSLADLGADARAINPRSGSPLTNDVLGGDRISGQAVEIGAVEIQANHAVNDVYSTMEGVALDVPAPGVLVNDQVSGELLSDRVFVIHNPEFGTVEEGEGREGGFLYTPLPGFVGTDIFTYVIITLDNGSSNEAHVTITVTVTPAGVNRAPTYSQLASSKANQPKAWERLGYGDCVKEELDDSFGSVWELFSGASILILKSGRVNDVWLDPGAGEYGTVSGKDISHAIVCAATD